jgi:selenocysteine lyase/cysteine desulfurase
MFFDTADQIRSVFAELVNAGDPASIAIIPSVSYGIATVARNVPVFRGQNIVVLQEQFPSNVYSWQRLAEERGALVVVVATGDASVGGDRDLTSRMVGTINSETAVVAIPNVHWADGVRINLETVGKRAREVGAYFVVDGSQSVGAVPTDVQRLELDALICAGYKWLFGPYGICLGYFGPRLLGGIPLEENWIAREGSRDFARLVEYRDSYQPGAIRYDVGEKSNFLTLPMMLAGLRHVRDWQPRRIQEYCANLIEPVLAGLTADGFSVAPGADRFSHLFGIRVPRGMDTGRIATALADRRVSVSVRGTAIRVAPHVYNDSQDVDALVDALREARNSYD